MQEATLPAPRIGGKGHHLRRVAALAISQIEISATNYPGGKHPRANTLKAFFDACSTALAGMLEVAPVNTVAPGAPTGSVSVAAAVNLVAQNGTWTGNPNFSYQWQKAGVDIVGATTNVYRPVVGDIGSAIRVKVTGYNEQATVTVNSTATANITA